MHRLVRLFVLRKMDLGSDLWNEVHRVALATVHEGVETELNKESKTFQESPYVFGNNHIEFVAHATALVNHYTLPTRIAEVSNVTKVEDSYMYSGRAMEFVSKT